MLPQLPLGLSAVGSKAADVCFTTNYEGLGKACLETRWAVIIVIWLHCNVTMNMGQYSSGQKACSQVSKTAVVKVHISRFGTVN